MINKRRPPLSFFSSCSWWRVLLFVALMIVGSKLRAAAPAAAQFDPIIFRGATVSATMPDIVPPTAPILISPEDGSIVSTNRPQFVWRESTDNVEMSHYQLYLDGKLLIDNIATTGSHSRYDLSYNSSLGHYFLSVKFNLDQGDHTWKIVAVDAVGLTSDSATWSFLIDSIAPHFVLTQIGDVTVSISSQDSSTIPQDPISLGINQPTLVARGETNSLVQLTVIVPGQDNYYFESEIDGKGNWSFQLPILPRDVVIALNFVIIDQARHISALEKIKIIIPSEVIVLPPTSITPSPKPDVTPIEEPEKPIIPTPEEPIEIPYVPPKEFVHEMIRRITPTPIWKVTRLPWFSEFLRWLGPWLVIIIVTWPIISATVLLAKKFGSLFSPSHLKQIWRALGLWPFEEYQGWAFDATRFELVSQQQLPLPSTLGIPFAKLTLISQSEPEGFPPYYHTLITSYQGLYPTAELPLKTYKLALSHPDYRYPTLLSRNESARVEDFYQAQELEIDIYKSGVSLQIPADNDLLKALDSSLIAKMNKMAYSLRTKIEVWLAKMILFKSLFVLANILLACCTLLFWPSLVNTLALSIYLLVGVLYLLKDSLFANIKGLVVDQDGNSVRNVLVRLTELEGGRQTVATLSDKNGRFSFSFKKGKYQLEATKPNSVKHSFSTQIQENEIEIKSWFDQQRVVIGS